MAPSWRSSSEYWALMAHAACLLVGELRWEPLKTFAAGSMTVCLASALYKEPQEPLDVAPILIVCFLKVVNPRSGLHEGMFWEMHM